MQASICINSKVGEGATLDGGGGGSERAGICFWFYVLIKNVASSSIPKRFGKGKHTMPFSKLDLARFEIFIFTLENILSNL